jgi:hypothetical protein
MSSPAVGKPKYSTTLRRGGPASRRQRRRVGLLVARRRHRHVLREWFVAQQGAGPRDEDLGTYKSKDAAVIEGRMYADYSGQRLRTEGSLAHIVQRID